MYENFVGTWETVRTREVSAWRGATVVYNEKSHLLDDMVLMGPYPLLVKAAILMSYVA